MKFIGDFKKLYQNVTNSIARYFFLGGPLIGIFFIHYTLNEFIFWVVCHYTMVIGVNISYHRYFSHRSFYTNRIFQFLIGYWGTLSMQRGPLWWSSNHRMHHRFCDTDLDPHSPKKGFFYSHYAWTEDPNFDKIQWSYVPDFSRYPEIRFLEYAYLYNVIFLSIIIYLFSGWTFVLIYHLAIWSSLNAEAFVNSLCHKKKTHKCEALDRYWVGILTAGDGFHRYHHINARSAKHSTKWFQFDATYYIICMLERIGLIKEVQRAKK